MELGEKLEKFLRDKYYNEILVAMKEDTAVVVDFEDLDRYDPITADQLLEDPDRIVAALCEAAKNVSLEDQKLNVRVRNLPESRNIRIRDFREKHLKSLLF